MGAILTVKLALAVFTARFPGNILNHPAWPQGQVLVAVKIDGFTGTEEAMLDNGRAGVLRFFAPFALPVELVDHIQTVS